MAVRLTRAGHRPFVGRTRELSVAAEVLANTERAGVVLIGGESGLGKTRLAEEIIAGAPEPTLVVRGIALPRATPVPFELVRSALDPLVARAEPPAVDYATMTDAQILATDRVRIEAEALRSLGEGPTIFVFEDVHWADPESLEVIDRLMVAGPLGASLLLTYRPNALHSDHPTSSFLQRAERRSHVVQFRLEPLRREEVAEYLNSTGREANAATVEHVHGRTGGNPLLLSELVAATTDHADLTGGLPWTLAEMLRPEIERLPKAERAVTEAVAVLGLTVDFDILSAAVSVTEDELLGLLRRLVGLGILVESGPDRFGFRHDMVREAVADGLFAREHRRIHAAVHDSLLASGSEDVVALVAYATGAGRTKQAADAARDAAKLALLEGRSHQALAFAEQALLEHTDDIDLLRVAVIAGWMTGQYRTAVHHLDRWEELIGTDPTSRAETLHHRVRLLWEEYDAEAADRTAEELQAVAETLEPGVALVQALADVAQHHMLSGRQAETVAAADRALEVAEQVGSSAAAAALQARAERASVLVTSPEQGDEAVRELLTVADQASAADEHLLASRALHNVPIQHPMIEPRAHIERMRREGLCAGISSLATVSYRRSLLVVSELEGDQDSYAAMLETAAEELDDPSEVELTAAMFAIERGDLDQARTIARSPSADSLSADSLGTQSTAPLSELGSTPSNSVWHDTWRRGVSALIDLLEGDGKAMARWMPTVAGDTLSEKYTRKNVLRFLSTILDAGLEQELSELLDSQVFADHVQPEILGVRAELAGDLEQADTHYATALDSGTRRSVVNESEIHLARARLAKATGADDRPHLEAAAQRLCGWPGRRLDAIEDLLGAPTPPAPTGGLTPREREVATLVSQGLTNGGIAEQLFISTKTASVHVSNILGKLNMASRAEIASWVASGGLD